VEARSVEPTFAGDDEVGLVDSLENPKMGPYPLGAGFDLGLEEADEACRQSPRRASPLESLHIHADEVSNDVAKAPQPSGQDLHLPR
jgi:hypothetical protein